MNSKEHSSFNTLRMIIDNKRRKWKRQKRLRNKIHICYSQVYSNNKAEYFIFIKNNVGKRSTEFSSSFSSDKFQLFWRRR